MTNWKEYKLDEIILSRNQGVNTTTEKVEYSDFGYKVLRAKNISDYIIDKNDVVFVNEDTFRKLKDSVKPQNGDILFTNIGSQLGSAAKWKFDELIIIAWNVLRITVDESQTNSDFLVYLLNSNKSLIKNLDSSSTMPFVSGKVLGGIKFNLPDLPTQTAIAEILSSLDDKIELNNQINKDLEALAQALFKQWFIDFEFPNENGEPYKSSGGEMVDSELGEIPKGWNVGMLGDLAKVVNGYAFKSKDFSEYGENAILKIRNVNGRIVDIKNTQFVPNAVAAIVNDKFKVKSGYILIAMTGAEVGKIGIVPKTNKKLWLNQRVGRFEPTYQNSIVFIHTLFNVLNLTQEVRNSAMGSAQPNISSNGIECVKCLIPSRNFIDKFSNTFSENYQMLLDNLYENEQLELLRDTLLPKLISGELVVSDIQSNPL